MTTILIILLILSQLICFYFIVLLNVKISKFKDLEIRQDKLIREMDDAMGAYLLEMREENDRFIKELSEMKNEKIITEVKKEVKEEKFNNEQQIPPNNELEIKIEQKKLVPINKVVTAYAKQKTNSSQNDQQLELNEQTIEEKKEPETFEEKVIQLHKEGKTIEEIAKIMEKGKTEVELLLKFHT